MTKYTNLPMTFSKSSLKRLYVCDDRNQRDMKARCVIWLLIFCEQLEEAALSCVLSIEDFKYLNEFHSTIKGLSNVKALALSIKPLNNEERVINRDNEERKRSWFDMDIEEALKDSKWIAGNKRSEGVFKLLSVTDKLRSLKLNWCGTDEHEIESLSGVLIEALCSLESSFETLKVLRLVGCWLARLDLGLQKYSKERRRKG